MGNKTTILYHDMCDLFHGNSMYQDIVIFALNKVFDINIFDIVEKCHNFCHQCQYHKVNTSVN